MMMRIKGMRRALTVAVALLGTILVPSFSGTARATHGVVNISPGCGEVVGDATTPAFTTFRLTANVGPCPDFGLLIGADTVELDLNGKRIFGCPSPGPGNGGSYVVTANVPARCEYLIVTQTATTPLRSSAVTLTSGSGDGAGVLLGATEDPYGYAPNQPLRDPLGDIVVTPRSDVAVIDTAAVKGRIEFFDAGIAMHNGNANRVDGVTVVDNVGSRTLSTDYGDGIYINNSTATDVRNNIVDRNGPYSGISIIGGASGDNVIDQNTVRNNNVTTYNYVSTPQGYYPQDIGIRLEGSTDTAHVSDNTVRGNGLDGIFIFGASRSNTIARNYVADNGNHGMSVRAGDGIRANGAYRETRTVTQALTVQAIATTSVGANVIQDNVVCANDGNGILAVSSGNLIWNNQSGDGEAKPAFAGTGNCGVNATSIAWPDFGNIGYYDLHDATVKVATNAISSPTTVPGQSMSSPCGANVWFSNTWTTRSSNACIS